VKPYRSLGSGTGSLRESIDYVNLFPTKDKMQLAGFEPSSFFQRPNPGSFSGAARKASWSEPIL
jgi:hypothetical protein